MAAATANPIQYTGGSSTPRAPPNTQASWSTVSERPNAEARDRSGRSRWITASRLTFANALNPLAELLLLRIGELADVGEDHDGEGAAEQLVDRAATHLRDRIERAL